MTKKKTNKQASNHDAGSNGAGRSADDSALRERAYRLGLHGLLTHWDEVAAEPWLPQVLDYEEAERTRRSLERRIRNARLGSFKPLIDFDWSWPKMIDREAIDEVLSLGFFEEGVNTLLRGPNGVGKTMLLKNLAHHALLRGYTVRFITASDMEGRAHEVVFDSCRPGHQARLGLRDGVPCLGELSGSHEGFGVDEPYARLALVEAAELAEQDVRFGGEWQSVLAAAESDFGADGQRVAVQGRRAGEGGEGALCGISGRSETTGCHLDDGQVEERIAGAAPVTLRLEGSAGGELEASDVFVSAAAT